jgi:hypothetical protein
MITSPGHVPPGMATVTSPVTARAGPGGPGLMMPGSRNRSGPRPGSGPKGYPLVAWIAMEQCRTRRVSGWSLEVEAHPRVVPQRGDAKLDISQRRAATSCAWPLCIQRICSETQASMAVERPPRRARMPENRVVSKPGDLAQPVHYNHDVGQVAGRRGAVGE